MYNKLSLILYSMGHLFVDAGCCFVMLSASKLAGVNNIALAIVIYNTFAFAIQPFFGYYIDKKGYSNYVSALGCILVGISAFFFMAPFAMAIISGIGNAMFHVGGGVFSLNIDRTKTAYAGVFVAPGVIGLFLGAFLADNINFKCWYVLIPMIIIGACVVRIKHVNPKKREIQAGNDFRSIGLLMLAVVIAFRAVIGSTAVFPWKDSQVTSFVLVLIIAFGKAFGGILADKVGRINTAVVGLLLSAPILAFFESNIVLSLIGILLFNFTMAVTLTEIADILYGFSGFAFGITTLALIVGTYTTYFGLSDILGMPIVTFSLIVISAVLLWFGLDKNSDKNILFLEVNINEKV